MPNYRRSREPGSTYFFTVNLHDRRHTTLTDYIELLRASVRKVKSRLPFHIEVWVVLPEHLHCLWTLPEGDADFPRRWRLIKRDFARQFLDTSRVWQRGYWEHLITDEADFAAHVGYVHFNPVKHGHVDHPADWPYSTFRTCVARGWYPPDWSKPLAEPPNVGE